MIAEDKEYSRLINLSGRVDRRLLKNEKRIQFLFWDEYHGKLVVTADNRCPLFYSLPKKGQHLKLKVILKGNTIRNHQGETFTNNYLVIKEVVKGVRS